MFNRRYLCIKVLQVFYVYFQLDEESLKKMEIELMNVVDCIYDFYFYLLFSFGELKELVEYCIEENKKKICLMEEDLNLNCKFVDSCLI